ALGLGYLLPRTAHRSSEAGADRGHRGCARQPLPAGLSPPRYPGTAPAGQAGLAGNRPDRGWAAGGGDPAVHDILLLRSLRRDLRSAADPAVDRDPARLADP